MEKQASQQLSVSLEWTEKDVITIDTNLVEKCLKPAVPYQEPYFDLIRISLRDEEGTLHGGLIGTKVWDTLSIDALRVDEEYRRSGYATKLLVKAENIAKEKQCRIMRVDTYSFQTPEVYLKNEFTVFGELEEPLGHTRYYMKKELQ